MYPAASGVVGLSLSARTERGYLIAALGGELDIAAAPILREKLLVMLGPAASRLIIDLSAISYADASGLAVLVATGRRARLLGGFLRLASPSLQVAEVLSNHRPRPASRYLRHGPRRDHQPGASGDMTAERT